MTSPLGADFGLDARARGLIEAVLRRHPEIVEVRVFGSRALGTHRAESDVDLALFGAVDEHLAARVEGELEELPLPQRFDVQAYRCVRHNPLREHIDRVGKLLYTQVPD